jgi:hypothetical protein
MDDILKHTHSGLRWIALILLIVAIAKSFAGMNGNKPYTAGDKKLALFTLIAMHLQLVIGLALFFIGKWYVSLPPEVTDATTKSLHRFFGMEHATGMILAIGLITAGYSKAKRAATDKAKFKNIAIFFLVGLVLILGSIPWPFMAKFSTLGWF